MRRSTLMAALLFSYACGPGAEVQAGLFFPTWNPDGAVPGGIVQGVLVETDGCLFVEADGRRTLPIWEEGLGFADEALLGPDGQPIAEVGEVVHGGGGYYSDRVRFEGLADEPIPDRCVPEGADRFALTYDVEAGPFTLTR